MPFNMRTGGGILDNSTYRQDNLGAVARLLRGLERGSCIHAGILTISQRRGGKVNSLGAFFRGLGGHGVRWI